MHDHVRSPVPGAEPVGEVERGQRITGQGAAEQQPARQDPDLDHPLQEPEPVQYARGVGRELQAGAELGELRGLLKHPDLVPVAGQGQGGGQPADAAADDQDVHLQVSPPTNWEGQRARQSPGRRNRRSPPRKLDWPAVRRPRSGVRSHRQEGCPNAELGRRGDRYRGGGGRGRPAERNRRGDLRGPTGPGSPARPPGEMAADFFRRRRESPFEETRRLVDQYKTPKTSATPSRSS